MRSNALRRRAHLYLTAELLETYFPDSRAVALLERDGQVLIAPRRSRLSDCRLQPRGIFGTASRPLPG